MCNGKCKEQQKIAIEKNIEVFNYDDISEEFYSSHLDDDEFISTDWGWEMLECGDHYVEEDLIEYLESKKNNGAN